MDRLRQQHPIEWIAMRGRDIYDGECVRPADGKLGVSIGEQLIAQPRRIDDEISTAERRLDGYLPKAGDTEKQRFWLSPNYLARLRRESWRICGYP